MLIVINSDPQTPEPSIIKPVLQCLDIYCTMSCQIISNNVFHYHLLIVNCHYMDAHGKIGLASLE